LFQLIGRFAACVGFLAPISIFQVAGDFQVGSTPELARQRRNTLVATIENVSGTAFVVAEFRAEENTEPAPLYVDPIVGLFLNDDSKRAAGRVAASFPPSRDLVRIRTKYLDDMLEKQLRSNVRQVVILGAGLDTRAVRKESAAARYFEIDDPATLRLKQECYERFGLDVDVTFTPGDYVRDGLITLLTRSGFVFDLPTYFIWEGNTMYLSHDYTRQLLKELKKHVRRFAVSFDYMADSVVSKTTGDPGITRLVESFEGMGAPWLSGIGDIHTVAEETGLTVVENFRTAELYQRYWADRPMTSPIFDFYSVCTLGSDRR
jgi:methyltransferase (TIGR00027 family)